MNRRTVVLFMLLGLLLLAPALAPFDPMKTNPDAQLQPPSLSHLFGTDYLGRDIFSRILHGGRRTLALSLLALGLTAAPGIGLGLWAGTLRGQAERIMNGALNVLQAFPSLLLALVIVTLLGTGPLSIAVATGLPLIVPFSRLIEAATRQVLSQEFVEATRSLGASDLYLVRHTLFANIQPTLWSTIGIVFGFCVLNNAALSFLGLSGGLGVPDWGVILAEARFGVRSAPWGAIAPGAAITALVVAIQQITADLAKSNSR